VPHTQTPSEVARIGLTVSGGMYSLRVGVTIRMHNLTAESGYDYLTRLVAELDSTEKRSYRAGVVLHRAGREPGGHGSVQA
jgi:hypothetical protein